MVVDRGNVVEFYDGEDKLAVLNREAESPLPTEFGYGFEGDFEIAILEGFTEDVAVAIICELLIDPEATRTKALDFLSTLIQQP